MRWAGFVLVALLGIAIVWGATDLPHRGDPEAPAAVYQAVAVYYAEKAYAETRTPNMVTAILVDYRGFDTFGEAVVVVVAALSCLLILRQRAPRRAEEGRRDGGTSTGEAS
jgi:multicomponent Na+:H+ antiporter subunit B